MKIFTIGFTKKDAKTFFELLRANEIDLLLDIRLNNVSQLAGFAKGKDLAYFVSEFLKIDYIHDLSFAPTKELLDNYRDKKIDWPLYEKVFLDLLDNRGIDEHFSNTYFKKYKNICLLCSEPSANKCHRRLVAEYIQDNHPEVEIHHI